MRKILLTVLLVAVWGVGAITVSDIASLRRAEVEDEPACSVKGVVSCPFDWDLNSFALVDPADPDGRGVFVGSMVEGRPAAVLVGAEQLEAGQVVEVTGHILPYMLEPGILASEIRVVDRVDLPPPRECRVADLNLGENNNRRVNVVGILREVSKGVRARRSQPVTILTLGTKDGVIVVRVRGDWPELAGFRDAELSVDGVCVPSFNSRAEFLHAEVEAISRESIHVIPSHMPPRSIQRERGRRTGVLAWTPDGYDGHLRKMAGEVVYVNREERYFVLQSDVAVRVNVKQSDLPRVGDLVEADGFPTLFDDSGILDSGSFRVLGRVKTPCPVEPLTDAFLESLAKKGGPSEYDAHYRLVRVDGRVLSVEEVSGGRVEIAVDTGHRRIVALLEEGGAYLVESLQDRPRVSLEGVLKVNLVADSISGRGLIIGDFDLLLRDASDIRVVYDLESTRRRISRLAARFGLVMLLPLGLLALIQWIRSSRQRERSKAVAEDRRRLAEELHDTIAQHLSGARLLLFSVQADAGALSEASRGALTMAGDILESARREMRDKILNLQSDEMMLRPLADLIKGIALKANALGQARVRTHLRGLPSDMAPQLKTDLLATVQEAVTNAVKHGHARNIAIVSDPVIPDGYVLSVLNDGEKFDAGVALGPATGHFGLSSMRERAARNGFKLTFGEREGWTEVRLERSGR